MQHGFDSADRLAAIQPIYQALFAYKILVSRVFAVMNKMNTCLTEQKFCQFFTENILSVLRTCLFFGLVVFLQYHVSFI